jgi:hypothetical protein
MYINGQTIETEQQRMIYNTPHKKTEEGSTRTPLKKGGLRCSGRVHSSYSTGGTCCVILVIVIVAGKML